MNGRFVPDLRSISNRATSYESVAPAGGVSELYFCVCAEGLKPRRSWKVNQPLCLLQAGESLQCGLSRMKGRASAGHVD